MAHVLIRHKVADLGKWKLVYDHHLPAREAAGLRDLHICGGTRVNQPKSWCYSTRPTPPRRNCSARIK